MALFFNHKAEEARLKFCCFTGRLWRSQPAAEKCPAGVLLEEYSSINTHQPVREDSHDIPVSKVEWKCHLSSTLLIWLAPPTVQPSVSILCTPALRDSSVFYIILAVNVKLSLGRGNDGGWGGHLKLTFYQCGLDFFIWFALIFVFLCWLIRQPLSVYNYCGWIAPDLN